MIRLICGGALCMCIAYVGLGIRRYYSERALFFTHLLQFIDSFMDNLSFIRTPLPRQIEIFKEGKKGEFIRLLDGYLAALAGGERKNIGDKMRSKFLKGAERELLIEMFTALGTLDSGTQINNLNGYRQRFKGIADDAAKKRDTLGTLAFKLGVLIGILVMIIVA